MIFGLAGYSFETAAITWTQSYNHTLDCQRAYI